MTQPMTQPKYLTFHVLFSRTLNECLGRHLPIGIASDVVAMEESLLANLFNCEEVVDAFYEMVRNEGWHSPDDKKVRW